MAKPSSNLSFSFHPLFRFLEAICCLVADTLLIPHKNQKTFWGSKFIQAATLFLFDHLNYTVKYISLFVNLNIWLCGNFTNFYYIIQFLTFSFFKKELLQSGTFRPEQFLLIFRFSAQRPQ